MIKILLVCDKRNWAYDSIARALIKYNRDSSISLESCYIKEGIDILRRFSKKCDLVFFLGWQLILEERKSLFSREKIYKKRFSFLEDEKILTGIHSHHAWDQRRTRPDKDVVPPASLIKALAKFRGVNAVSKRLATLFKKAGLENIVYTPNGVDIDIFKPVKPLKDKGPFKAGYSGSLKHDWRKGITELIEPACKMGGVELKKAMPADGNYVPLDDMPRFYNEIDTYICASSSEGFSLSVLEASACGRPVISTHVGGCEDLIKDGINGFLVDRSVDDITKKIKLLNSERRRVVDMGHRNRKIVEDMWSWKTRVKDWIRFIKKCSR